MAVRAGGSFSWSSTRRDLIRGLLGLSALPYACRKRDGFETRFVDPDFRRAHRAVKARSSAAKRSGSAIERKASILILGGGVSGLSAGWKLQKAGLAFDVLELESELGGTAITQATALGGAPWGAHYVPAPTLDNPELVGLFSEMGMVDRRGEQLVFDPEVLVGVPEERVFHMGTWQPGLFPSLGAPEGSARALERFEGRMTELAGLVGEDGRRAFALPMAASSQDPRFEHLDQMSFSDWIMQEGFHHSAVKWLASYATRDDFGARPDQISAWYGLHYFAARRDPVSGRSAPFLTWPGGNGRIVDYLAQRIGSDRLNTGRAVTSVERSGAGWAVMAETEAGRERWLAPQIIWALPDFLKASLLGIQHSARETSSWLVANLHLRRRPGYRGFETAWDNILFDSPSLGYVVSTHQFGPWAGPSTWTWYLPLVPGGQGGGMEGVSSNREARQMLLSLSPSEAADLVLADLGRAHHGLSDCIERIDFRRWGHAMAQPVPGSRNRNNPSFEHLHFAHSDGSGVGLFEEAFYHGVAAAEQVIRSTPA